MSTMRLPARREFLERLQSHVMETVRELGLSPRRLFEIELTLEEILTNVIRYAYPGQEGEVAVDCEVGEDGILRISLQDWGAPFNPTQCRSPMICQNVCDMPVGGLGIHLARKMADDLLYERLPDGNRLTILFRL